MKSFECCSMNQKHAGECRNEDTIIEEENSWAIVHERGVGIWTFIRYSKTAQVQIVWLLLCVLTFIIVGAMELEVAISNETSEYKPQKITSSIDYGQGDISEQYEMPYIYITFRVTAPASYNESSSYWTDYRINSTLSSMLEAQDFSNSSVEMQYDYNWVRTQFSSSWEEADVLLLGNFAEDDEIVACFRLKSANPDPALGPFGLRFYIVQNDMTLGDTIDPEDVRLVISRDEPSDSYFEQKWLQIERWEDGFGISLSYDELVLETLNPATTTNLFNINGKETWDRDNGTGTVEIIIWPNPYVPVYSEYVEFGFTDWIGMMGGYFSLLSVAFLFVSNHIISNFVEDPLLGILPMLSFAYDNREMIMRVKTQLLHNGYNDASSGHADVDKKVSWGKGRYIEV